MQTGRQTITYRKLRRRRPRYGAWAILAVTCAVLGFVGVRIALPRHPASSVAPVSAPSPAAAVDSVRPNATATVSAARVDTTAPAAPEVQVAANPAPQRDDAVTEAAVSFPGAPAVKVGSINHLEPKHKYIAFTLDDGYGFQPQMLKLLQKYDARCTTFLIGSWMKSNKKTVRRLRKSGFEIANHTWDHATLTGLSDAAIRRELLRTQEVITSVTGNQAPYMRPPGGGTDQRVARVAASLGYKVVLWNGTFADSAKHPSPEKAYRSVMTRWGGVHPGDIILCHWGSENSYEAMKRILPELAAQGYKFVTLSELIADSKPSKKHRSSKSSNTDASSSN
jgi:peptidoglycan-N-acetylglucosamine deacetylase